MQTTRQGLVTTATALTGIAAIAAGAALLFSHSLHKQIEISIGANLKLSSAKFAIAKGDYKQFNIPNVKAIKIRMRRAPAAEVAREAEKYPALEMTPVSGINKGKHGQQDDSLPPTSKTVKMLSDVFHKIEATPGYFDTLEPSIPDETPPSGALSFVSEEDRMSEVEIEHDRMLLTMVIQKSFEKIKPKAVPVIEPIMERQAPQPLAKNMNIQKDLVAQKLVIQIPKLAIQKKIPKKTEERIVNSAVHKEIGAALQNKPYEPKAVSLSYADLLALVDKKNDSDEQPKVVPAQLDSHDDVRQNDVIQPSLQTLNTQEELNEISKLNNQIKVEAKVEYSQLEKAVEREEPSGLQLLAAPTQMTGTVQSAPALQAIPVNDSPAPAPTTTNNDAVQEEANAPAKDEQQSLNMVNPNASTAKSNFTGRVVEAFTSGNKPVVDATVQVLGTDLKTKTNYNGEFSFSDFRVAGVLPVILKKDGFLKRRMDLKEGIAASIEMVSENTVQLTAVAMKDRRSEGYAFIFGQVSDPAALNISGYQVQVSGPSNAFPIYLNEQGAPDENQKSTSSKGQFILLNLKPGTYLVNFIDAFGGERAPHLMHVSPDEGVVRKFSLGVKRYIEGKVRNAVMTKRTIDGATIRLLGSRMTAVTSKQGSFRLGPLYVDCNDLNYLQIEKDGFYRNRIDYGCPAAGKSNFYAFSSSYVDGVALDAGTKLKTGQGVVFGHTGFTESVKAQLWGADEIDPSDRMIGRDYYFADDGVLRPMINRTEKNGNFAMFDVPEGYSYMQMYSKDNATLSFWPIFTSSDTISVYIQ